MLGLGGKKDAIPTRVGAREKLRQARNLMGQGDGTIKSKKEGKQTHPAVAVVTIYCMAVALAWLLTENVFQYGFNFRTGWKDFDDFMFRRITAEGGEYLMEIGLRGFAFFIAAGIVPFLALLWQRALDKADMNVHRVVWGVPIGLGLVFFGTKYFLWPLLEEVGAVFTG